MNSAEQKRQCKERPLALSPCRVLNLSEGGVPTFAKILADLGADLIKIEKPMEARAVT
jgi:crotonobetainyl-CoA:carnitine CoA-transferase CaiB-like acyl-CoA transferase